LSPYRKVTGKEVDVLYEIYTSADVALTAATAKTVLMFTFLNDGTSAPLVWTVTDWDVDIEGAAGTTSALVELVQSTQATTGTTTADNTAFTQLSGPKLVNPTTAQGSGGYGCGINRNYTAEPTALTPLIGPRKFLQGSSWTKQFPLGLMPVVPSPGVTAKGIGVRITAPVAASCRASFQLRLGSAP
jgi:hypothetical protein